MTTYISKDPLLEGQTFTDEYVNEDCTFCGTQRLRCAELLGYPFIKTEESK